MAESPGRDRGKREGGRQAGRHGEGVVGTVDRRQGKERRRCGDFREPELARRERKLRERVLATQFFFSKGIYIYRGPIF